VGTVVVSIDNENNGQMQQIEIEVIRIPPSNTVNNLTLVLIMSIVGFMMLIAICIGCYNCYMLKVKRKLEHDIQQHQSPNKGKNLELP